MFTGSSINKNFVLSIHEK